MNADLVVEHLSKTYTKGDRPAVDDVSFDAKAGEFLVLLGPSGCGKTTIMRSIAGLERADRGRIAIGDLVVTDAEARTFVPIQKRQVGMVFQSYAIWPHLTVAQNIAFPLQVRKLSAQAVRDKVKAMMETLQLEEYGDRLASKLSGGQQQRVALARALVYEPRLLLLDEPLSNLDAELRARVRFELKELQRRSGVTSVYVTHDQTEAVVLGDRVLVMSTGHVEQASTPAEMYKRPATSFVATFTGVENLIAGEVIGTDGDLVSMKAGAMTIRGKSLTHFPNGARVTAAFRAGNLKLGAERPAGEAQNVWDAVIGTVTFLGVQNRYTLTAQGQELVALDATSVASQSAAAHATASVPYDLVSIFAAAEPKPSEAKRPGARA